MHFLRGVVNSKNVKALGVAYNSRKCITRHKELNIMKKFNNAKMTEEELDQVAGGQVQKHVYLYYGDQGLEFKKETRDLSSGYYSCGHGTISTPGVLARHMKKWKADGYIIIKQWEQ